MRDITSFSIKNIHRVALITLIIILISSNLLKSYDMFNFIKYLDEFMFIYLVSILFSSLFSFKISKYNFFLIMLVAYMVAISWWENSASIIKIVLQSLIHVKFFIFYFLIDRYLSYGDCKKIITYLLIFTGMGFLLNVMLQEYFSIIIGHSAVYRDSLLRIEGFQLSANFLGLTLGLFYLFLILKRSVSIRIIVIMTVLFVCLILLTGSRTSLSFVLIGLSYYFIFIYKASNLILIPTFLLLLVVFGGGMLYSGSLDRTFVNILAIENGSDSGYIRGIMLYYGFQLCLDFFPFGSGAATFGSVLSEGSWVYDYLGLSSKSFFLDMTGVYDSNIATLFGEFGVIGVLFFGLLLFSTYKQALTSGNKIYLLSIFTTLFISAITMPVFMNAYPAVIFSLFVVFEKKEEVLKLRQLKEIKDVI